MLVRVCWAVGSVLVVIPGRCRSAPADTAAQSRIEARGIIQVHGAGGVLCAGSVWGARYTVLGGVGG